VTCVVAIAVIAVLGGIAMHKAKPTVAVIGYVLAAEAVLGGVLPMVLWGQS
jgi:hypothetical protein